MKVQAPILVDEGFVVNARYERTKQEAETQNVQKENGGNSENRDSFEQPSELALIRIGLDPLDLRRPFFFISLLGRHVTPHGPRATLVDLPAHQRYCESRYAKDALMRVRNSTHRPKEFNMGSLHH